MELTFYKYQGTGNDFVMIDNRALSFPKDDVVLIERLCNGKFGVGADGLIFLKPDSSLDFRMVYLNADGGEVEMCGNGTRALTYFYHQLTNKKSNKYKGYLNLLSYLWYLTKF